ncbi:uncharacterized protein MONOS_8068 [Monocercomonoides exilis]|uniref:uncharacterized protein n=1 Tax=Monocercomonoides exilis TaxID=2049356 RepID=UPI00355A7575|nr:hypothetical protein MONOS_8068 [Monocercomonoides exilis]|eukprot:MONOS_8068.1-p1 / transcript=MONOS_8068.1 / gene=MONOS_8068 / organism=Monocercomonoides_exilis_PA203 / gene_product=unspecified product / transcript_product=unspecified product / location=Mono_scaffold00294:13660-14921(+) / protein_length=399 / sequence_SO=supercontig / SO=protein_coding / is_pseudo=false
MEMNNVVFDPVRESLENATDTTNETTLKLKSFGESARTFTLQQQKLLSLIESLNAANEDSEENEECEESESNESENCNEEESQKPSEEYIYADCENDNFEEKNSEMDFLTSPGNKENNLQITSSESPNKLSPPSLHTQSSHTSSENSGESQESISTEMLRTPQQTRTNKSEEQVRSMTNSSTNETEDAFYEKEKENEEKNFFTNQNLEEIEQIAEKSEISETSNEIKEFSFNEQSLNIQQKVEEFDLIKGKTEQLSIKVEEDIASLKEELYGKPSCKLIEENEATQATQIKQEETSNTSEKSRLRNKKKKKQQEWAELLQRMKTVPESPSQNSTKANHKVKKSSIQPNHQVYKNKTEIYKNTLQIEDDEDNFKTKSAFFVTSMFLGGVFTGLIFKLFC